jgi:hypothetical protein
VALEEAFVPASPHCVGSDKSFFAASFAKVHRMFTISRDFPPQKTAVGKRSYDRRDFGFYQGANPPH